MKKIVVILVALLLSVPAWNQGLSKKDQKKLAKELKKEQKAEEAALKALVVKSMVEKASFVLEANQLRGKGGTLITVSSTINFIASDSISGVIQVGNDGGAMGSNGLGGVTVEGRITNYQYTHNPKKGTYAVSYMLKSVTGNYDVRMNVFGEGRADAIISSNWPGRINYVGYLVPPSLSKVFKGTSL